MEIDITRPKKLYRYSEKKWLVRSLNLGEFRLWPAADYKLLESDFARQDDELVRVTSSPASRVTIMSVKTSKGIKPVGHVTYRYEVRTNYLTICFSEQWNENLFEAFSGSDACLVIHNVKEFCERIHLAVEKTLPQWSGMDASIVYFGKSKLGPVFSKPRCFFYQHEWRFAWLPVTPKKDIEPIKISIGNIENIAEIIERPPYTQNNN